MSAIRCRIFPCSARFAPSEPVLRRAVCGSPARTDPWEPRGAIPGATRLQSSGCSRIALGDFRATGCSSARRAPANLAARPGPHAMLRPMPKYPLEPVARLRAAQLDDKARELAESIEAREGAAAQARA